MKTSDKRQAQIHKLETRIHGQAKKFFTKNISSENPVVHASHLWDILKEQLEIILGDTVYQQWFHDVRAIVIADNILILKAKDDFACKWISTYYQELVDTLLSIHDKNLSCFFVDQGDLKS